jgi:putative hydrolase of the HAD superfamily
MADMNASDAVDRAESVIFDLFHTLTSIEAVMKWGKATHEILGVSRKAWLEQLLKKSRERLIGRLKDPVTMMRTMAHAIDPAIPPEVIREATENRRRRFENALKQIPEASKAVLVRLDAEGKKLGLVSNADAMEIAAWDESPIAGIFDCTVFSCVVGYAKPDREIYEICLRELAVRPRDAVFVGDGGSDELKGAREVGMTTVMMTGVIRKMWPERIEPRLPFADFVIERLDELVAA